MTAIKINGASLYYEDHGTGKQTVLMLHGLGFSGRMYQNQYFDLRDRFRCITLDFRGQGRSDITWRGYDMDSLTLDVATFIRKLGLAPCHVVGLSMGGFVALRLALDHPGLLRSMTLLNTSARTEPAGNRLRYGLLAHITRVAGLRLIATRLMHTLFGSTFMTDPAQAALRHHWRKELLKQRSRGLRRAARGVVRRRSVADRLAEISLPALIIAGGEDIATPAELAHELQEKITGSQLIELAHVGHNSAIEAPKEVTTALRRFLSEH